MLKQHQDLLEAIEHAEELSRGLYARGARVDETVRTLHQAGNQIKERIAHYKRDATTQAKAEDQKKAAGKDAGAPRSGAAGS